MPLGHNKSEAEGQISGSH